MPLIPGQVIHERYHIVALLNKGGMGAVYETMDSTLGVRCALKEMTSYPDTPSDVLSQLREQFLQEAQLLATLRHPNLPRVTDYFEEDNNVYLVMDYIHGRRLDETIAQEERLTEDQVLGWAQQLMKALVYCHEHDIIHRDVKPQNVIITPRMRVVLVDFGLAKLVDPDAPHTRTVMRGLGTPEYAPPEQYDAKKGSTDVRTDIYSLATTLYHALAGEAPPTATERIVDPQCLIPLHQRRDDISSVTEQVLAKAMSLQPSQRFQGIAQMYEALFGSPMPGAETGGAGFSESSTRLVAQPSGETVLLSGAGAARLRIGRPLGIALVATVFVSLVVGVSLMFGRTGVGGAGTATATSTASVTATPTRTPTPTSSPTATFTPSPTPRPSRRQPTPDELYLYRTPVPASPTPMSIYIPPPPTSTYTPAPTLPPPRPPTNTPPPTDTPPPPTDTPPPATNTPPPPPTSTSTSVPTARPSPTP